MFSARSLKAVCCAALSWLWLGCADPRGSYEDFVARANELDAGASGGGQAVCSPPAPGAVAGRALMAIGTTISPGQPILFYGDLETPARGGKTAVLFRYRALSAADRRTEVGDGIVLGPYAIEDDGSFEAPTQEMTLPGEANALLPGVPITSQLTLVGRICGVQPFYCGQVTGRSTFPVEGPIEGTFGLELVEDELPTRPRYGCEAEQVAVPLPE